MYRHWDLLINSLVHCGSQSFTACPLSPFRNGGQKRHPFYFPNFGFVKCHNLSPNVTGKRGTESKMFPRGQAAAKCRNKHNKMFWGKMVNRA